MTKTLIFKCQKGNEWWYLYSIPNKDATRGYVYRVYCGRRWHGGLSWYTYEMALWALLEACLGIEGIKIGGVEI